nr:phosphatidate cytidylyltransferase [Candidatus Dormibacteraeota bacterium]
LKPVPVLTVLAVALVAGLTALLFLPPRRDGLGRWSFALAGALYVGLPFNYYLQLYESHAGLTGQFWLLAIILTVVVSDSAAYLIGRAFGHHSFFPAISPQKTWEGAIAGVVFCVPVMGLAAALLLHIGPWHGVALGLVVGLSAEFGDLVESQLKRLAGVKDSSQLIPGHGGLLDRLDSIFFPPIVVYLYLQTLGLP